MIKIVHLADTHIKNEERHDEYKIQFEKLYKIIQKNNIDIVTIVGDLFDNFIQISNEAKILAGEFLNNLSNLCKEVIIVHGNHDLRKKNLNRTNSIETIVRLINNPKVVYFGKSGFYNDSLYNIVWVNHSHSEKQINPWKNIQHIKDNSKIYIDLFHDPINGCSINSGAVFKDSKLRIIKDFKGDISMFGDIHKFQYFRKNKTAAYSSSLIQQNFGESLEHGVIIWSIDNNDITSEFIQIDNEHTFINLYIDEGEDYDDLSLNTNENIGKYPKFKIHWKELSSNINTENERKIRSFIKNKYDSTKIKFDKTYIYTDIVSSKMLSETLDLNNKEIQRKIFKEYLEEQKYKKNDIDEILNIDDEVNDRLELTITKTNIEWKIEKFWFDNFKVFGDKNEIDWKNLNGIFQIFGKNQQGKTTILDVITYILYGTTITTEKREKHGDNRYINNKRKFDKCSGGAVLDIDGDKITILRKTERKWNRSKTELASCSTNVDYYDSEDVKEKNKQTGERKTKTQKKLNLILGDFKDFVRISLTNADNLNELLSADRSIFMDSIIRDAGYDIFEKKQNEYKNYKKDLKIEKVIINVQESEQDITDTQKLIKDKKSKIINKKSNIKDLKVELKNKNLTRDNLIKKLNNIDESMVSFDINISNSTISNYIQKIDNNKTQIIIHDREINDLPSKFEPDKLDNLNKELKQTNNKISKIKEEISIVKTNNNEVDSKVDKVKQKLREFRDKEISNLKEEINIKEKEISNVESDRLSIINSKISSIKDVIKKNELDKINLENKIKNLKKDGANLKHRNDEKFEEIEEFENSSFCPACGRDYDESTPDHLEHIQNKIKSLKNDIQINNDKIKELINEYKDLTTLIPELDKKIILLKSKRDKLISGEYDDEILSELKELKNTKYLTNEIKSIDSLIERLKNNDLSVNENLKIKFDKGKMLLKKFNKDKNDNLIVIKNLENELKSLNIESIEDDIRHEDSIKENYELRKEKLNLKEKLTLNIDNYFLKIKEIEHTINKFKMYESQIEKNKEIQIDIDDVDDEILLLNNNVGIEYDEIFDIKKEIVLQEKEIEIISFRIDKFIQQKREEELMKEYQRCISRDGIPTYLLKKSIHLINKELNDLLTNVDFTLFFNDNLILKLSMDDRLDVSQNAIESSGKERTFCALTLKIALRQINVKSRPNFIILDEIMGKLYEKSIMEFIELLDEIKNKIDKIIIIEHVHPINYDGLITVKKEDNLISSLTTDF